MPYAVAISPLLGNIDMKHSCSVPPHGQDYPITISIHFMILSLMTLFAEACFGVEYDFAPRYYALQPRLVVKHANLAASGLVASHAA